LIEYLSEVNPKHLELMNQMGLHRDSAFMATLLDMLVNTSTADGKCLILNRFTTLLYALKQGNTPAPEMIELVVNIAKHNNRHSVCDKYMRQFAKSLIQNDILLARKLEVLLNTEIAIKKTLAEPKPEPSFQE